MSEIFCDLSGKIDRRTLDALTIVKDVAGALAIPFFVVGATARDLILIHCFGLQTARMTLDIDLGVQVEDWKKYEELIEMLIATGKFSRGSQVHRFTFDSLPIDIIPFGGISDSRRRITWPPEHEIDMSLVGFQEACEFSVTVRLSSAPELDVKLPSLPGLALLKIISWRERYPERQNDAEDLLLIMQKYEEAGNQGRLYDKEQELIEEEGFDLRLAAVRLLGRDIAAIAQSDTVKLVKKILDEETKPDSQYKLIQHMMTGRYYRGSDFEMILSLLEKLRQGIVEASKVQ